MSLLALRPSIVPQVQGEKSKYIIANDSRAEKGGIANGTYYFMMGTGSVPADYAPKYWDANIAYAQMAELTFQKCQMVVKQKAENFGYVNWHYTGPQDPIEILGYRAKDIDFNRLREIYAEPDGGVRKGIIGGLGNKVFMGFKTYEHQIHVPVLWTSKLVNDDFDTANAELAILVLTASTFMKLCEATSALSRKKGDEKSPAGWVFELKKNTKLQMADMYKIACVPDFGNKMTPDIAKNLATAAAAETAALEKILIASNGGTFDPNDVWNYLLSFYPGSKQDFIAEYSLKLATKFQERPSEVINFAGPVEEEGTPFDEPVLIAA